MAEIKSTLDLVLERTKNLTMTKEEKSALQRKELEGKIRGWGQRYMDGLMDLGVVKTEMALIPADHKKAGRKILKGFVLENLDTTGGKGKIFNLLEEILEESREPYLAAIQNFQKALAAEGSRFLAAQRASLADRGISGSAVIPNLDREGAWKLFHETVLAEFRKGIALIRRDN